MHVQMTLANALCIREDMAITVDSYVWILPFLP
jgi:hypothetical protein